MISPRRNAMTMIPARRQAVLLAMLLPILLSAALPAAEPSSGKLPAGKVLFDGKNLDGWEHVGPGRLVLEHGLLKTEGGMGLLWYKQEKFGDCVLRVVYKTTRQDDNSGVYVRIAEPPQDPWFAVKI